MPCISSRVSLLALLCGLGGGLGSCRVEQRLLLPPSAHYQAAAETPITTDTARPTSAATPLLEFKRKLRARPASVWVLRPLTHSLMPRVNATSSHANPARRYHAPRAEVQHRQQPAEGGVVFGVFHLLLMLAAATILVILGLILFPVVTVLGLFAFAGAAAALVRAVLDIIRMFR